ncbi:hypothetical protein Tco_0702839 [Tanacetum coccineum]|uniref:Uncharacterized protein n=1 Tax=Tanacetum coccineum TaxID=301880 RepID=A0ABQ4XYQ4_9ASTR
MSLKNDKENLCFLLLDAFACEHKVDLLMRNGVERMSIDADHPIVSADGNFSVKAFNEACEMAVEEEKLGIYEARVICNRFGGEMILCQFVLTDRKPFGTKAMSGKYFKCLQSIYETVEKLYLEKLTRLEALCKTLDGDESTEFGTEFVQEGRLDFGAQGEEKKATKSLDESHLVRKLLDSTPDRFIQIVASIEQTSDLDDISFRMRSTGKTQGICGKGIKAQEKEGKIESQEKLTIRTWRTLGKRKAV